MYNSVRNNCGETVYMNDLHPVGYSALPSFVPIGEQADVDKATRFLRNKEKVLAAVRPTCAVTSCLLAPLLLGRLDADMCAPFCVFPCFIPCCCFIAFDHWTFIKEAMYIVTETRLIILDEQRTLPSEYLCRWCPSPSIPFHAGVVENNSVPLTYGFSRISQRRPCFGCCPPLNSTLITQPLYVSGDTNNFRKHFPTREFYIPPVHRSDELALLLQDRVRYNRGLMGWGAVAVAARGRIPVPDMNMKLGYTRSLVPNGIVPRFGPQRAFLHRCAPSDLEAARFLMAEVPGFLSTRQVFLATRPPESHYKGCRQLWYSCMCPYMSIFPCIWPLFGPISFLECLGQQYFRPRELFVVSNTQIAKYESRPVRCWNKLFGCVSASSCCATDGGVLAPDDVDKKEYGVGQEVVFQDKVWKKVQCMPLFGDLIFEKHLGSSLLETIACGLNYPGILVMTRSNSIPKSEALPLEHESFGIFIPLELQELQEFQDFLQDILNKNNIWTRNVCRINTFIPRPIDQKFPVPVFLDAESDHIRDDISFVSDEDVTLDLARRHQLNAAEAVGEPGPRETGDRESFGDDLQGAFEFMNNVPPMLVNDDPSDEEKSDYTTPKLMNNSPSDEEKLDRAHPSDEEKLD